MGLACARDGRGMHTLLLLPLLPPLLPAGTTKELRGHGHGARSPARSLPRRAGNLFSLSPRAPSLF